jgi:thymidylate synthase (FAD)
MEACQMKLQHGRPGSEIDPKKTAPGALEAEQRPVPQQLTRPTLPALDAILGQAFRVLDDGFVRLLDYMGDDAAVVQAARISYGIGTKPLHEDRGLIRYLMRHSHTTPFEMCEIKLHVRVPMDAWRQWIRHRTANVNEYSTRYSVAIDAAQRTSPDQWRTQSPVNRQGSSRSLPIEVGRGLSAAEQELQREAREVYEARIAAGVAREQARKDLPLSTYTEAYWKIDLHNLLHFLNLRLDDHAQREIREYARIIGEEIVSKWVPIAWEAFLDYRRHSVQLSRIEVEIASALNSKDADRARDFAAQCGLLNRRKDGNLAPNRERAELEAKLHVLGLTPPWSSERD